MNHLHVNPLKIEIRGDVGITERIHEDSLLFINVKEKEVYRELMKITVTLILSRGDTITIEDAYTDMWEMLNYEILPDTYLPIFVDKLHSWVDDQITLVELQRN